MMAAMINRKHIFSLWLWLLLPGWLCAQVYENQQWFAVAAKYKINKEFSVEVEEGFRVAYLSYMSTTYTEFALGYKFNKHFKISGGYRLIYRGSWSNWENLDNRFFTDFAYSNKFGDFKATLRTRFQLRYRDWHTSELGWRPQFINRNKLTLTYDMSQGFEPFASVELFHRLNDLGLKPYTQQARFALGLNKKLNDNLGLSVYYMFQPEFNSVKPEKDQIFGIDLSIDLN